MNGMKELLETEGIELCQGQLIAIRLEANCDETGYIGYEQLHRFFEDKWEPHREHILKEGEVKQQKIIKLGALPANHAMITVVKSDGPSREILPFDERFRLDPEGFTSTENRI